MTLQGSKRPSRSRSQSAELSGRRCMLTHRSRGFQASLRGRLSCLMFRRDNLFGSGIWPVRGRSAGCTCDEAITGGFGHWEGEHLKRQGHVKSQRPSELPVRVSGRLSRFLHRRIERREMSVGSLRHSHPVPKAASITASRSAWSITFSDPAVVASTLMASPEAGSPHEKSNVTMSSRSTRSSPLMSAMHSQVSARPLALRSPASQRSRMLLKLQSVAVPEFKMTKYSSTVSHSARNRKGVKYQWRRRRIRTQKMNHRASV